VTKDEFADWLEENKDEAIDMMRDYNKSLTLWLNVFHAQLKALAVEVAEGDEPEDDEPEADDASDSFDEDDGDEEDAAEEEDES
jgi:hypothetical protein